MQLSEKKQSVVTYMDRVSETREHWIRKNQYYYKDLCAFLKFNIPEGSSVLEIGCGTGYLLDALKPDKGVGIDISPGMIRIAKQRFPHLRFLQMDAESLQLKEKFDYILISDTLGYLEDIQNAFTALRAVSHAGTRIIITYHNFIWTPFLSLAEFFKLKMPRIRLNWLNAEDITNLLCLEGFGLIKKGRRLLLPAFIPGVSWLCNKYLAHLPGFNGLTLMGYIIARPENPNQKDTRTESVSVIIPARNEKGNIEAAMQRMPRMGKHTEIIFVEGHSQDGTLAEIKRVCKKYSKQWDVHFTVQDGKGKGDAVRKGFAMAKGDILMILDADLTVPPEDLPKFYLAIATGKGEYINGTRLVYPMEKEAMRSLNLIANHWFSLMFSWLLDQRLKDTLCGTKVISKLNYEKLLENRGYFGDFDPFGDFDLIFGSAKLNLKIIEVPIRYQAREYGQTNISRFRHGWLLIKMVFFAMSKIKFI